MKAVPALAKLALNSCQRANGEMYIDLKVRDYAGEAKREERQESIRGRLSTLSKTERGKQRRELANHSPIFRYSSRLLGTIADQPFFRTDVTWPHEQLPALSARLHSLMLQLVVDQPTTAKLQSLLTELNRTLDEAICQIEVLDSLSEAFEAANLSHMVQWATAHDRAGVKYYAMGNKIVRELPEWQNRSLGDLMSVEFPPEFRALDQSRISELRRFFG
jgi:hypothetical protein